MVPEPQRPRRGTFSLIAGVGLTGFALLMLVGVACWVMPRGYVEMRKKDL